MPAAEKLKNPLDDVVADLRRRLERERGISEHERRRALRAEEACARAWKLLATFGGRVSTRHKDRA